MFRTTLGRIETDGMLVRRDFYDVTPQQSHERVKAAKPYGWVVVIDVAVPVSGFDLAPLSPEGVCELLSVDVRELADLINDGLPTHTVGRHYRFLLDEVLTWLREQPQAWRPSGVRSGMGLWAAWTHPMQPWQRETLTQIRAQASEVTVAEFLAGEFEGDERFQRRAAVLRDALREMVADPLGPSLLDWLSDPVEDG
jgi:excisionase family DNA binding protein